MKHVKREKVPSDFVSDLKAKTKSPSKKHLTVQERATRESELFGGAREDDDDLVEMSIREVKKVVV